jgi:hypothetical protein
LNAMQVDCVYARDCTSTIHVVVFLLVFIDCGYV